MTPAKRNILFGLLQDDEFAPVLNGESTHWEWCAVHDLHGRKDLHQPTSLLLGGLSQWVAQFPRRPILDVLGEANAAPVDTGYPGRFDLATMNGIKF